MLTNIVEWLLSLQPMELILWCIALFFSLLCIVQGILSMLGGAFEVFADGDYDGGDYDGDSGFQFFTVRNMIVFFTMFGWSGLAAYKGGVGNAGVIFCGLVSGSLMVFMMYLIMMNAHKMRQSGTIKIDNALDKVGETYLRIPGLRSGTGKVNVHVQGRMVEMDAITDDAADIATGRAVKIINKLNNQVVIVTQSFM